MPVWPAAMVMAAVDVCMDIMEQIILHHITANNVLLCNIVCRMNIMQSYELLKWQSVVQHLIKAEVSRLAFCSGHF